MMILFRQNWSVPPLAPTKTWRKKNGFQRGNRSADDCEPTQKKQRAHVFHRHHHTLQLQAGFNSFEQFWAVFLILSKVEWFLGKIEQVLSSFEQCWADLFPLEKVPDLASIRSTI